MRGAVRRLRALSPGAACVLLAQVAGCATQVDEPVGPRTEPFIALARDFEGFTGWERFAIPDIGTTSGHDVGDARFVYSWGPIPAWGEPFPVGSVLVKTLEAGAPSAWDVTRGAGVVIAISDTGVDAAHPDIAANLWTNPGEIPGNASDDDGNGFVDDIHGWDSVNEDNDPFDDNGHGTHVAGTAAAIGNNGIGIVGVAWEASIMVVKGLSAGGAAATGYGQALSCRR